MAVVGEQIETGREQALRLIEQAAAEGWKELDLSEIDLVDLPIYILDLTQLEVLILGKKKQKTPDDKITEFLVDSLLLLFPPIIQKLWSLRLDVSKTQLSELPESIAQLTNLRVLDLRGTQISELPESITQLKRLQSVSLSSCRISQLPVGWQTWEVPAKVDLRGNPLPIPEVLLGPKASDQDPGTLRAILNFYFQTQDPEAKPLYEAKLLIVGEGEAGKTTLAKKLQNPFYKLKLPGSWDPEKSTEGIDIIEWQFEQPDGTPFRVNVWDFGGQELYHATHQFFLTNRSLYALVVDNRRENPNFYYWLNVVRLLSDKSPIFIVKNEKQDRQCEINEGQLRAEFGNLINQTVRVNFADNRGLDELKTFIQKHITTLKGIQDPWPHKWVKVRYALENYSTNYIRLHEYLELCRINGVTDFDEALQVSGLLHELGICLHFQKELGLKDYVILSPTWVTNAIYRVTDDPKVTADMGRFSRDDLNYIWSSRQYATMRDELLGLMQMKNFGICYPLKDRPGSYIVPSLLSPEQPEYVWDEKQNLILRYEYEFMPKGLVPRLIVEMHEFIEPDPSIPGLVWKTGVILCYGKARAEVIENYEKREIFIRVVGPQRKTLLDWIRRELYKIHSTYPNLEYDELIPCNCTICTDSLDPHAYPYQKLLEFIENGRLDERCDKKPYENINIRNLISDITDSTEKNLLGVLKQPPGREAPRQGNTSPIIIQQTYQESPQTMATYNQTNTGGTNFQNNISGGQVNQAESINNNNQPQSVDLVADARTILFLASNPKQTGRLRLDQELRELDESLRRAQRRSQFKLENKGAIRTRDFTRALLDSNPHIVHFSGHGKGSATDPEQRPGLLFEDETGHPQLVSSEQLADVFELFADQIECVLINACHSHNQADAIAQHIPYVIGMSRPISDKGAIEFAIAFYDAIGAGRNIPFAFKFARTQLTHLGEKDIPQLWSNSSSAS